MSKQAKPSESGIAGTMEVVKDAGALRPLSEWKRGERGVIRVYRRVDPKTGAPVEIEALDGKEAGPKPKSMPGGARWYEWPSDGVQFY